MAQRKKLISRAISEALKLNVLGCKYFEHSTQGKASCFFRRLMNIKNFASRNRIWREMKFMRGKLTFMKRPLK